MCRSRSADHAVMFDPSGRKSCRFILTKQQVVVTRGANTVRCIQGISVISKEKNLHQPALVPVGRENRGVFFFNIYINIWCIQIFHAALSTSSIFRIPGFWLWRKAKKKTYKPLPLTLTAVRWRSHKPSSHTSAVHYWPLKAWQASWHAVTVAKELRASDR